MHGLAALKALLQCGVPARGFEAQAEVGGNWNFGAGNSRVYETTKMISSKPFTQLPDFPMPDSYPDYPSHSQVQEYFTAYASHFGLYDRITFGAEVVRVEMTEPGVLVTWRDLVSAQMHKQLHAGVVIANGHNWHPKVPEVPGLDGFAGTVLHSADYKCADVLVGKRVLVVGAGNTGCDIAVEAAQRAEVTLHSSRRGYFYNPKFVFGRPSDQVADLLLALHVPLPLRRLLFRLTLAVTVGDLTRYGAQSPDHQFFETHPIVNQQWPYYLGHGDITAKPDLVAFDGKVAVFSDDTRAEIDLVVFATGYLATFPFVDPELLAIRDGRPSLGRQMFTPNDPRVVVSGLIQPDSGQWTLAHWQGMLAGKYAQVLRDHPTAAHSFHEQISAEAERRFSGGAYYADSTRHFFEVAHQDYLRALEQDLHVLEVAG